jgi:hypothetical protein
VWHGRRTAPRQTRKRKSRKKSRIKSKKEQDAASGGRAILLLLLLLILLGLRLSSGGVARGGGLLAFLFPHGSGVVEEGGEFFEFVAVFFGGFGVAADAGADETVERLAGLLGSFYSV